MEVSTGALNNPQSLLVLSRERGYAPYDVLKAYKKLNRDLVLANINEALAQHILSLTNVRLEGPLTIYMSFPKLKVRYIEPVSGSYAVIPASITAGKWVYNTDNINFVGTVPPQPGIRSSIEQHLKVERDVILNRLIDLTIVLLTRN